MEQPTPLENKELIAALRNADINTMIGKSIHKSLDENVRLTMILNELIGQIKDYELNDNNALPKILGEGYEFIINWLKSYKLL